MSCWRNCGGTMYPPLASVPTPRSPAATPAHDGPYAHLLLGAGAGQPGPDPRKWIVHLAALLRVGDSAPGAVVLSASARGIRLALWRVVPSGVCTARRESLALS